MELGLISDPGHTQPAGIFVTPDDQGRVVGSMQYWNNMGDSERKAYDQGPGELQLNRWRLVPRPLWPPTWWPPDF